MTETIMPPEMLAKLGVLCLPLAHRSPLLRPVTSPNLFHRLSPLYAILRDPTRQDECLSLALVSLPRFGGKEVTARCSRQMPASRPPLYVYN